MRNTACVVCGRELKPAFEDSPEDECEAPPNAATVFCSHGNFGSTMWDPVPRGDSTEYLQITICDKCLSQAAGAGRVLICQPQRITAPVIYSIWPGPVEG